MLDLNELDGSRIGVVKKVRGQCPHCRNHAALSVQEDGIVKSPDTASFFAEGNKVNVFQHLAPPFHVRLAVTLTCDYCDNQTIFHRVVEAVAASSLDLEGFTQPKLKTVLVQQLWPSPVPREIAAEAPEAVRAVFADAAKAEAAQAFSLAGVGYRAVVEQIVKDQGAAGDSLYKKIEDLRSRGLTEDLISSFHEARAVGNTSVHDGMSYAPDEVADIAELITEAIHALYVVPAQRAAMQASREARRSAKSSKP